jgi:hypothetical protein
MSYIYYYSIRAYCRRPHTPCSAILSCPRLCHLCSCPGNLARAAADTPAETSPTPLLALLISYILPLLSCSPPCISPRAMSSRRSPPATTRHPHRGSRPPRPGPLSVATRCVRACLDQRALVDARRCLVRRPYREMRDNGGALRRHLLQHRIRGRIASPSSRQTTQSCSWDSRGLRSGARCRGCAPRRTLGTTQRAWQRPPRTRAAAIQSLQPNGEGHGCYHPPAEASRDDKRIPRRRGRAR